MGFSLCSWRVWLDAVPWRTACCLSSGLTWHQVQLYVRFLCGFLSLSLSLSLFFFFVFLGPLPQHLEVPRLGVESELQLQVYTTATATRDPRCVCNLCCSFQQCWILNPLSEARARICILMDTSQVPNLRSHTGNSQIVTLAINLFRRASVFRFVEKV